MTIPSKQVAIVDVPEVSVFNAVFQYSFFEPRERVDIAQRTPRGNAPRVVKLSWNPVSVGNRTNVNRRVAFDSGVRVSRLLDKVVPEDRFSAGVFIPYNAFQGDDFGEIRTALSLNTKANEGKTPLEASRTLNDNSEEQVEPQVIVNTLMKPENYGLIFGSDNSVAQNARTNTQLNSKLIADVMFSSLRRGKAAAFTSEMFGALSQARQIQREGAERFDSSQVSISEYQLNIPNSVTTFQVDPVTYDPYMETIGYIIEKKLLKPSGTVALNPIVIDSADIDKVEDLGIRYGESYLYAIRTVAYVELLSQNDNEQYVITGFLVSSKPTALPPVLCVETVAPPWPVDFRLLWDYDLRSIRLSWGFPVNSQRDIKGFQVLYRETIEQPFQLLRYFDFDDSVIKTPLLEQYIAPELREVSNGPVCNFTHLGIEKGIYAICSVDAHGLSSNYSMQLEAWFDKSANKIQTKLISVAGAPKAYPNFYLNSDTFVDLMKFEGHNNIDLYFSPEFLKVFDHRGEDVGVLAVASDSINETVQPHYELNLINVDNQKPQTVRVSLRNRSGRFFQNLSLDS
jgi:hypothetical protein